jgi:hypothetical protein
MSNLIRVPLKEEATKQEVNSEVNSSPGNNSISVTPKDLSPQDAAARDVVERKITSSDPDEKEEALLDDAIEMTYPASDPPAISSPRTGNRLAR